MEAYILEFLEFCRINCGKTPRHKIFSKEEVTFKYEKKIVVFTPSGGRVFVQVSDGERTLRSGMGPPPHELYDWIFPFG